MISTKPSTTVKSVPASRLPIGSSRYQERALLLLRRFQVKKKWERFFFKIVTASEEDEEFIELYFIFIFYLIQFFFVNFSAATVRPS